MPGPQKCENVSAKGLWCCRLPALPAPLPGPGSRSQEEGEDAATPPSPPSARDGPAELRLPQRAMKMEKKTVAGLSKRWLARAVAQAELILQ